MLVAVLLSLLLAVAVARAAASAGRPRAALAPAGAGPLLSPSLEAGETLMGQPTAVGRFGTALALSADGTTALVGAPRADGDLGAVTVYVRSGSTWSEQAELSGQDLPPRGAASQCVEEPGEEAGECGFGRSVALSADGDTALVGAPRENGFQGAAWVFVRSGSTWSLQGQLELGEAAGHARLGTSVALSADGDTALVGAPAEHSGRGGAWIFTRSGVQWTPAGQIPTGAVNEQGPAHFGRAVALSADASTALVGAPANDEGVGAAWVFTRGGETWSQSQELEGAGEVGAGHFGASLALSGDGNTVLVGAHNDSGAAGAAWTFERSGSFFNPIGPELAGPEAGGSFAASVALSDDGHTALVGAPVADANRGAAWWLIRSGATWSATELGISGISGESGAGRAGFSVALSADASVGLVGGPRYAQKTGAAWPFLAAKEHEREPAPQPNPGPIPGGSGGNGNTQTNTSTTGSGSGAHNGVLATNLVGAPVFAVSGNIAPLAGHVYVKLPGTSVFVPLTGLRQVPFGTVVDATHGKVKVTTMTPSGHTQVIVFFAGRFKLTQSRNGVVIATLVGGSFSVCPTRRERLHIASLAAATGGLAGPEGLSVAEGTSPTALAAASRKHVVRKLWAEGHGKYETKGNYASGAVQGTRWLTEDLCDGTLIHVASDRVLVVNLLTHRHRSVRAPHSYLAKAP
ncbi:MAG TPA: hypothetical protein VMG62_06065 [Solirubrobacteraceae bacterium]|nr:hypothetical protein [Solirubrobacteraceae bacterium]